MIFKHWTLLAKTWTVFNFLTDVLFLSSASLFDIEIFSNKKYLVQTMCSHSFFVLQQRDKSPESTEIRRISVDLYANPSLFTVYAAVRQTVLEQCMNEATHIYHQSVSPTTDSDSDEDSEEKSKELAIKLPKVYWFKKKEIKNLPVYP